MSDGRRRSSALLFACVLALCAALTVVAVGCGDDDDSGGGGGASSGDSGGGTQKVDLLLSYQRSLAFIGEIMAQENGYFADEGLEVKPIASEGGSFVTQQLIAGNQTYGLAGVEGVDIAVSKGSDLRSIFEHDRDIILMGTPEDGDIQSVQDLEGKSLGITDPGGGEVALVNAVLEDAGLTGKVNTPAVGPGGPAVYAALKDKKIAAYAGYTNDLAGVEAEGLKLRNILPEKFRGLPSNTFAMTEENLQDPEKRDTMIKIVRAWNRGTIDALNDPEAALKIACDKYVPEECKDMNVARAFMNATLEGIKPREGKKMGEFDYDSLQTTANLLADRDLGDEPIDFEKVFTNDYIDQINDFTEPKLNPDAPQLLTVDSGGN
jgi:NitT/TauT family transport system substrate-binding protein